MAVLWKILLVLFVTIQVTKSEQLICYSKTILQSQAIYNFFKDVTNGFFIDIYPEHPIKDSSTVYLDSLNWNGINILNNSNTVQQFRITRTLNINKQFQIIGQQQQNTSSNFKTLSQICNNFIYKKPQFMSLTLQVLSKSLSSTFWSNQDCKPQFILIKQYSQNKIEDSIVIKMTQYGYTQLNSYQNFVIFIQSKMIDKFKEREKINSKIIQQNKLLSFSKILSKFSNNILHNNAEINQLKGSIIGKQLQIKFAKYYSTIDIFSQQLSQRKSTFYLIMQFNSEYSHLKLPKNFIKNDIITLSSNEKYYHIAYSPPNQKQLHYYIFDHHFSKEGIDVNDIIFNQMQIFSGFKNFIEFKGTQIEPYRLDDVQRFGKKQKKIEENQNQQKQQLIKERDNAIKQLQKYKQQYVLKQKQKEQNQQLRRQNQKILSNITKNKQDNLNKDYKNKKITIQATQKDKKINQKEPISYLTPQSIFTDQNIKNKTIIVIILICCMMGTILLTAVITACIMKRQHIEQMRQSIKNNAQMHTNQQITDGQPNKEQYDEQNQN